MNSPDDCFALADSGLSTIDVDDHSGDGIITITQCRRKGEFPLMRLPLEVRLHIFSFLLPDVEEIYPGNEDCCSEKAGSINNQYMRTTYRRDDTLGKMAIMRASRQIYEETANYLYDRLTIGVYVWDNGVDFLSTHWGCGCIPEDQFSNMPLHKFKCIRLQVEASESQPKYLVHVFQNLLNFCSALYQSNSLRNIQVDFWDTCHYPSPLHAIQRSTGVQGGVKVTTEDVQRRLEYYGYNEDVAFESVWRAANSTGTTMVATDIELILQPIKLLRNASSCQIFLTPKLQEDASVVELVAGYKEIVESKKKLTLEDLKFVHDTSEDIARLATNTHDASHWPDLYTEEMRMESLLWQTRGWHSMQAAPDRRSWYFCDGTLAFEVNQLDDRSSW